MPTVTRNPLLREDLIKIWTYIAADNPSAADRLLDMLEEKFELLARNPRLGVRRTEILPDIRSFPVGNYVILYRSMPNGVEIVRVIHGQRDLTRIKLQ
jgi:toxin ParE1/3/4